MNLRKADRYTIGLDLGTGSVGWAVVDENGELYHIKGKPTWGSRLFPTALTAADTRLKRGQRRRYDRRRQRIDFLQTFFFEEMEKVDPQFFVRLRMSRILPEDKDYTWLLFNTDRATENEFYKDYPTIYHLRDYLMHSNEKADIRLVYLALHNIVKYRGNFLHEDEGASLKAENADASVAARDLVESLSEYIDVVCDEYPEFEDGSIDPDVKEIQRALDAKGLRRAERSEILRDAFGAKGKAVQTLVKELAKACLGMSTEFSNIYPSIEKSADTKFSVDNEDKAGAFVDSGLCPDEGLGLYEALRRAYSAYVLSEMLAGSQSISQAMINSYERHKSDLKTLKELVRDHLGSEAYNDMFRGPKDERGDYDINVLPKESYTAYIAGEKKANGQGCSHDAFLKHVRELLASSEEVKNDLRYKEIEDRLNAPDSDFLAKQKTRANGAIPYQLHLEEMDAIITAQGRFYPFLVEHRDELEKIVSSRIPYYVGPLNCAHDPLGHYPGNPVDHTRKFGWSVRKPGMEHAKAYPWNVEEVIDTDETATRFIQRMTGTCTYLFDEPVLPRCSLLYEEFCVLNELNGVKWANGSNNPKRFDRSDREAIIEEKFKRQKSVGHRAIQEWLTKNHGVTNPVVTGTQGEKGFESKLSSYNDFRLVLGVERLEDEEVLTIAEIEEIILWNTVFEDRDILTRKLTQKYGHENGGPLTEDQIKSIVRKRYTGWGRLSRKLLTGVRVPAAVPSGTACIMDVLREGNPCDRFRTVNFMETITDKELGFQEAIDKVNEEYFGSMQRTLTVDDMQGSPANRRTVNQALRIIEEIVHITGKEPARICIEVTRDDDQSKKGKRTKSRYVQIKAALDSFKADAQLYSELNGHKDKLDDKRLALYFAQGGKCMYSGTPLDINQLQTYQIDHIIPQSYTKDDSFNNTVLVKSEYNQRKLDSLLLDDAVINKMGAYWHDLLDAGLITRKKYESLTCRNLSERQLIGFINRQLVETSQVIKFVRQMCEQRYPNTEVVSVRASISHGVRDNWGLVKCRELNNYHHAHDAFLACQVALFVGRVYPKWQDGFDLSMIRKYIKLLGESYGLDKRMPGRSGFIADRLTYDKKGVIVDTETGEVLWDAKSQGEYVRKALGYKQCFVTRMPEEQTGAFWDETVYSPRDKKNGKGLTIPLKASGHEGYLDPAKYGGPSSVKQAYWFIFTAKDKKGRDKFFFEGVPIHLVNNIKSRDDLQLFAEQIAQEAGCTDVRIMRDKVPLRQKLELDGTPYYLFGGGGGVNEIRPTKPLIPNNELAQCIARLFNDPQKNDIHECMAIYKWLTEIIQTISPDLKRFMQLEERATTFESLTIDQMTIQLQNIIKKLNGSIQKVDISAIGGGSKGGDATNQFYKLITENHLDRPISHWHI